MSGSLVSGYMGPPGSGRIDLREHPLLPAGS